MHIKNIILLAACFVLLINTAVTQEVNAQQPTSQPTIFFVAPSVPPDDYDPVALIPSDNKEDEIVAADNEIDINDSDNNSLPNDGQIQADGHEEVNHSPDESQLENPERPYEDTRDSSNPGHENGAVDINEEIREENLTAINSASYIFYTFVLLVAGILLAYLYKKMCGGSIWWGEALPGSYYHNSNNNHHRYAPVEHHDPEEFFSKRNIELANHP